MTQGSPGSENGPTDSEWKEPLNSSQVTAPWRKKPERRTEQKPETQSRDRWRGGKWGVAGLGVPLHWLLGWLLFWSSPLWWCSSWARRLSSLSPCPCLGCWWESWEGCGDQITADSQSCWHGHRAKAFGWVSSLCSPEGHWVVRFWMFLEF